MIIYNRVEEKNEEELGRLGSDRELLVKIRARQMMRFVGHVMRRGKTEDPSLTGRKNPRL